MSIRYAITFKNMINVYKTVRYSQIEKCMLYFDSTYEIL